MPLVVWNDRMSVGVDLLDKHHKHLINILNTLNDALESDHAEQSIGDILNELVKYALYHFSEEERLMRESEFPDVEKHINCHEVLTADLNVLVEEYAKNSTLITGQKLRNFIANWLINHIMHEDALYGKYIKKEAY